MLTLHPRPPPLRHKRRHLRRLPHPRPRAHPRQPVGHPPRPGSLPRPGDLQPLALALALLSNLQTSPDHLPQHQTLLCLRLRPSDLPRDRDRRTQSLHPGRESGVGLLDREEGGE